MIMEGKEHERVEEASVSNTFLLGWQKDKSQLLFQSSIFLSHLCIEMEFHRLHGRMTIQQPGYQKMVPGSHKIFLLEDGVFISQENLITKNRDKPLKYSPAETKQKTMLSTQSLKNRAVNITLLPVLLIKYCLCIFLSLCNGWHVASLQKNSEEREK